MKWVGVGKLIRTSKEIAVYEGGKPSMYTDVGYFTA
jgi:hypothetical protein